MARKEYKFLYIVGGVFLAYVASLWAFHESLQQILLCTVVSQGCLFVAMFLFKFFPLMKRRFQKISA